MYLKTVLRTLPNLQSLTLTRASTTNMPELQSRGTCLFCTKYMEKAEWIDAVAAHPRLQRFLAFSADPVSLIEVTPASSGYVQIRLMARKVPRGIARWISGREGFENFGRELQSAQDLLRPHDMGLRSVAVVMVRIFAAPRAPRGCTGLHGLVEHVQGHKRGQDSIGPTCQRSNDCTCCRGGIDGHSGGCIGARITCEESETQSNEELTYNAVFVGYRTAIEVSLGTFRIVEEL